MNILVTHGFEANYTLGFAKGLVANGIPICVLSCDDTEKRLTASGIRNINIRGPQNEQRSRTAKAFGLLRYYGKLLSFVFRNRGSTVHFTGIFRNELIIFEGLILHVLLKVSATKYIYTVHNILPHNHEDSLVFQFIYRFLYHVPDVLLVHTDRSREWLERDFAVPRKRIIVASIGLNEEIPLTDISNEEAKVRLGYMANDQVILFFGRVDQYKGLHLLIEAFNCIERAGIHLLIAGKWRDPEYGARIEAQIRASRRKADIRCKFRLIPNEEIETLFKAADVLCMPYLNIYQSGVLFLAMRFGIPCVATKVGALSEIVTPEIGVLAPTIDREGVKSALESFFERAGTFDRDRIKMSGERFGWDRICHALIPLYERPEAFEIAKSEDVLRNQNTTI
jgi:glycosyltransferase involved in cell wall biosynthesis